MRRGIRRLLLDARQCSLCPGQFHQLGHRPPACLQRHPRGDGDPQINGFPGLISLSEGGVSQTTGGFDNRDVWYFSNDRGQTAYQFQDTDYFSASFSVVLTDSADSPRKEAGFLFSDLNGAFPGGDLQLIVDS